MRFQLSAVLLSTLVCAASISAPRAQCVGFGSFAAQGNLPTNLLPSGTATQVSGMVASRHNPNVLWVHDDVFPVAQIIAVRGNGMLAQQYQLVGATNRDWEEITIGPGPTAGRDYLYLAETGNNALNYTSFSLIRVPEPDVPATPGATAPLTSFEVFRFRYPSGTFNTETLWIDPVDATPYFLTKENGSTCRLFRYPLPLDANLEKTLVLESTFTGMPAQFTGGAISADGRWIFARTVSTVYAWPRPVGTRFVNALANPRCAVAHSQGLAEAISVAADGRSLWAVSEGVGAVVARSALTWPAGAPAQLAFGTGLGGNRGVQGLAAIDAPRLGGPPLVLAGWQGAANAFAILVLSPTGLPDGAVPFAGGWLHALPDVVFTQTTSSDGTSSLFLGVLPDAPLLYGVSVYCQSLIVDSSAPQGVALSAGLRLVLDR